MANGIVQVEYAGVTYKLDIQDLDGREMGTIGRMRRDYGDEVGTTYGVLLIAKQRAGERVTEDDVLKIKARDIKDATEEDDVRPPARESTPTELHPGSRRKAQ